MKKILSILFLVFLFQKAPAQIVFCPPGAEWHYSFLEAWPMPYKWVNEKIRYTNDSVVDGETVKVLQHARLFNTHNGYYNPVPFTVIKQKGDTVFFRNASTQHAWQILYNYAAQPGQSWQNTSTLLPVLSSTLTCTYTITVDSVATVPVNSFNLKRLYVRYTAYVYKGTSNLALNTDTVCIDERMGCHQFLFNFYNRKWSTGIDETVADFLCYSDNTFGSHQLSSKPCNYSDMVGIGENNPQNSLIKIYPNPATVFFTLNTEGELITGESELNITDVFGKEIKHVAVKDLGRGPCNIDIAGLAKGIYLLKLSNDYKVVYTGKLIKSE